MSDSNQKYLFCLLIIIATIGLFNTIISTIFDQGKTQDQIKNINISFTVKGDSNIEIIGYD